MQTSFEALQIAPALLAPLQAMQIVSPTPIQAEAIPLILAGKDVIAQSQTGTGKTLAYLLPTLHRVDQDLKQLQVMVLVPTRELGMQIIHEIEKLTEHSSILAQPLIGGASVSRQIEKLRLHPQIVVGTPGRILELIKVKKLSMHYVQTIVVDEVDQVFDLGSMIEVEAILKSAMRDRQILFFSATISKAIEAAAMRWMKEPALVHINPAQKAAETLEHLYFVCEEREKIDTLRRLVRLYNPKAAIVFINETDDAAEVVQKLSYVGLTIEALFGEASKQDRARAMSGFREGRFQLLLATDVAARGLDLIEVTHVFNLDLPVDADHYIHRAGRTGRMGRKGTVISIVARKQQFIMDKYAKTLGVTFEQKDMYEGRVVNPGLQKVNKPDPIIATNTAKAPTLTPPSSKGEETVKAAYVPVNERAGKAASSPSAPKATLKKAKTNRERDRKNKGAPKWLKEKANKPEQL
ncbi:DEAD/DEAH box helicase [Paenibacillus psychroresistens]|uniref:DEAD/DEAH box helicase n=1 Tax=Paenibacillus psychroresistens TaxID=1778678 RepID=A0A6B8RGM7_9BACL|nr:DEAD/DEAH box helicase [Paenibacillus psychroresistens]QGQ94874.1 DEAD/DEAH box helicase [Paenibacillus psychroresistens]